MSLLGVRRDDKRNASVAFALLFLMMAGHGMLEAARDALFLASLPARYLPWAYLAMAALTLVVAALNKSILDRFSRSRTLSATLVAVAGVTLAFWGLSSLAGSAWSLILFYVWVGLAATLLVMQFWLLLADVLDIGQAKRSFAVIGAGGLSGAAAGALGAGFIVSALPAQSLLVAACILFVGAAALPPLLAKGLVEPADEDGEEATDEDSEESPKHRPYVRQLLLLVLVSTVTVTGVDYVFKAVVADRVEPERLGSFFANFYAVLNGIALVVQLAVAPRLLRAAGVTRALVVMPAVLLSLSVGLVAVGGLTAVLLLRGADGAMRHSINRAGTELLYFPLPAHTRERFKALAEAMGQRGGQALASVLILSGLGLGASVIEIGWALIVLAAVWLGLIFGLRPHYTELFREQLRAGEMARHSDVPNLDLHSLEAMLGALSSEQDDEVIAALDLFAAYDKQDLMPALVLYHPSPRVVLKAYELVEGSGRHDVLKMSARLLRHANHRIRAAALRYYTTNEPSVALLNRCLNDDSAAVRATAVVGLIALGEYDSDSAREELKAICEGESLPAREALAMCLRLLPADEYADIVVGLATRQEAGLVRAVAESLEVAPHNAHVPALIQLLGHTASRSSARAALVKLGNPALERLQTAMVDDQLSRSVRRHVPRTISCFEPQRATKTLVDLLLVEADKVVAFKILRGLGRVRSRHPEVPVDAEVLYELAQKHLSRAVEVLQWRVLFEYAKTRYKRATETALLLEALLKDQERVELERHFRVLHIVEPREEFRIIYDGLRSPDPKVRASSRELMQMVVPESIREGIFAMVDDASALERLEAARVFAAPDHGERVHELLTALDKSSEGDEQSAVTAELDQYFADTLKRMVHDSSPVTSALAAYYAAELGLEELEQEAARVRRSVPARGMLNDLARRTHELFESLKPEVRRAT